ncbi:MAG: carbohydrate kinase [Candidatus Didemnitutus sp.]|nr:carbohydrate kinase [Candidatus Didemnitutus sp.]
MRFRCVGLGEVLWDVLPAGRQLGGAPANFACHAAALGAAAAIVSRIGRDPDGRALDAQLRALGVSTLALELDPRAPTGTVTVEIVAGGQPRYAIHEDVAWDHLAGERAGREAVAQADAVCFGTLAQRHPVARATIRALLVGVAPAALRIFDVNLRQHYHSREVIEASLALANVLKVNEDELPVLRDLFRLPAEPRAALAALAERHRLRAVVYTRGAHGCLVWCDGQFADHPGRPVTLVDAVGAGDSFTAAFAMGLLHRWPLAEVVERASAIAAFVCTQRGATPALPDELTAPFRANPA